jgi:hypothetical protein
MPRIDRPYCPVGYYIYYGGDAVNKRYWYIIEQGTYKIHNALGSYTEALNACKQLARQTSGITWIIAEGKTACVSTDVTVMDLT